MDPVSRQLDLDSDRYTENTRAAYPIAFIDNAEPSGQGGHPKNIVMLTADAFGVLPPIARLSADAAMYHFLSGYTAKVAGTEKGVTEPKATFSACFGAPFLPLPPGRYATMLGEKIARHQAQVWLVNTGWTGGPLRHRHTNEDPSYARHDRRRSGRHAGRCAVRARSACSTSTCRCSARRCPDDVLLPRRTWADARGLRPAGVEARSDVHRELREVRRRGRPGAVRGCWSGGCRCRLRRSSGWRFTPSSRRDRKSSAAAAPRSARRRTRTCAPCASGFPGRCRS